MSGASDTGLAFLLDLPCAIWRPDLSTSDAFACRIRLIISARSALVILPARKSMSAFNKAAERLAEDIERYELIVKGLAPALVVPAEIEPVASFKRSLLVCFSAVLGLRSLRITTSEISPESLALAFALALALGLALAFLAFATLALTTVSTSRSPLPAFFFSLAAALLAFIAARAAADSTPILVILYHLTLSAQYAALSLPRAIFFPCRALKDARFFFIVLDSPAFGLPAVEAPCSPKRIVLMVVPSLATTTCDFLG